ncbi:MAG: hypothetical protein RL179_1127 [Planctomycetota bacterium]
MIDEYRVKFKYNHFINTGPMFARLAILSL